MANLVTHISYFNGHVLHPQIWKIHTIDIITNYYVPYVLVEVILEALCYYYINLNPG